MKHTLWLFIFLLPGCAVFQGIEHNGVKMDKKSYRITVAANAIKEASQMLQMTAMPSTSEGEVAAQFARVMVAERIAKPLAVLSQVAGESASKFWAVFIRDTALGLANIYYAYEGREGGDVRISEEITAGRDIVLSNSGTATPSGSSGSPTGTIPEDSRLGAQQHRAGSIGGIGNQVGSLEASNALGARDANAGINRRSGTQQLGEVDKLNSFLDNSCGTECQADNDGGNDTSLF